MKQEHTPKVGVGVMVMKGNMILLGKRKGSHGEGEYAFPGGHLEYLESFETCAQRELEEECGIRIKNLRFQFLANVSRYAPKHYVHIGMLAEWEAGIPEVREPEKCAGWDWHPLEKLPQNLFEMARLGIESFRTGKTYYDLPSE